MKTEHHSRTYVISPRGSFGMSEKDGLGAASQADPGARASTACHKPSELQMVQRAGLAWRIDIDGSKGGASMAH